MMERSPRAPVLRAMALRAMAPSAPSATVRSTPSMSCRNHQHSSERTSSIPKQERATDQNAMLVLAGGARRVFQRNRASRRDANNTAAPTQREAEAAFIAKVKTLAPKYRTELLPPSGATGKG
jgi:hypothetical protein